MTPQASPVISFAAYRSDQGIAVRRKRESAVDPIFDADFLQYRIAIESHFKFVRDAVRILLE